MADEPKAPEPAKPAEPAPAAPAAPAAGGAPPTKMIMMGCGGLAAVALFIVLIWGLLSLFSCGGLSVPGTGPDLATAESCAKSFVKFQEEKKVIALEYSYSRRSTDLDQMRALLPWQSDKAEYEKDIKKAEAWTTAYGKHRSELRSFTVDVIENKESDGYVKVKVTGKQLQPDGENYKIADRTEETVVPVTKIEGKWKVKRN